MGAFEITFLSVCLCISLTPKSWNSGARRDPSVSMCNPSITTRQRLSRHIPAAMNTHNNGSINTFPQQRIHTQQHKDCWTGRFLCDPCHITRKFVCFYVYRPYRC
jgi:hypothetical protein